MVVHGLLARIVSGEGQRDIPRIPVEEIAEVTHTPVYVLIRVEDVAHSEGRGGARHQLHQALRTLVGYRRAG